MSYWLNKAGNQKARWQILALLIWLSINPINTLWAAPEFPSLSGRVVDQANLLSSSDETQLSELLAKHEAETSNQVVVVTLQDLQGYDIAKFGLELARHWQIGQKDRDNGALLIVAVKEKKIRIEVGYGLEGYLTDAVSASIIRNEIRPSFRSGAFAGGIKKGVNAMLGAIAGSYTPKSKKSKDPLFEQIEKILPLLFLAIIGVSEFLKRRVARRLASGIAFGGVIALMVTMVLQSLLYGLLAGLAGFLFVYFLGSGGAGGPGSGAYRSGGYSSGGFGSGGGFGGGGFSGGGGSFGGGGASGGW